MVKIKKLLIIILSVFGLNAIAQKNLKYSGFFDSYYTTGPVKYFVEPGITMMNGELAKGKISAGIGAGVNYRVLPAIYLNSSLRYLSLSSKDHVPERSLSFKGSAFQFNVIGNYHFIYDMIRKSYHRRRGAKKYNAYISFGLSFNLIYNANTEYSGISTFETSQVGTNGEPITIFDLYNKRNQVLHFPIGLGVPIRVTPRFTITPEIVTYFSAIIPFLQEGTDRLDGLIYSGGENEYNDTYTFLNVKFMFNPKGKRLHPKQPIATNRSSTSGSSGNFSDNDDDFNNSKDENTEKNDSNDNNNSNSEDENKVIEENNENNNGEDQNTIEEEKSEDKYDEDGFLIDEK